MLQATADAFDANFARQAPSCTTTTRSAASCTRASGGRTSCAPATGAAADAGRRAVHRHPDAAHHAQEPGRLRTDLQSRVLDARAPISGLYCVGEAAGFPAAAGPAANARSKAPSCPAASSRRVQRRDISLPVDAPGIFEQKTGCNAYKLSAKAIKTVAITTGSNPLHWPPSHRTESPAMIHAPALSTSWQTLRDCFAAQRAAFQQACNPSLQVERRQDLRALHRLLLENSARPWSPPSSGTLAAPPAVSRP